MLLCDAERITLNASQKVCVCARARARAREKSESACVCVHARVRVRVFSKIPLICPSFPSFRPVLPTPAPRAPPQLHRIKLLHAHQVALRDNMMMIE